MVKAALIGAGYLGRFHAEKYSECPDAELTAVVDVDRSRAFELAERFSAACLTDYQELPALGVQCASIASDTSTHYHIARWLLEHGIDVLVEKPITVTVAEADDLIALAKQHSRILQVGHLERFNPAFKRVQERLNRPLYFEARRIAQFSGRGADVDVVRDLMIHDLDIIANLVNRPIKRIDATGVPVLTESLDIASARIVFEGGCVANLSTSRVAFKSERTIRIFQPDIYVSLDYGNKSIRIVAKSAELDERGLSRIDFEELKVEPGDALRDEINSFINCVSTRNLPIVSGEDGRRALEIVEEVNRAVVRGLRDYDTELIPENLRGLLVEVREDVGQGS
jgi:predicted dehydrogenase